MTKQWYTIQELIGMTGVPSTPQGLRKLAKREQWQSQPREKGKGLEYHLSALPETTKACLAAAQVQNSEALKASNTAVQLSAHCKSAQLDREQAHQDKTTALAKQRAMLAFNALPTEKQQLAHAKIAILQARSNYLKQHQAQRKQTSAEKRFVDQYNRRELPFDQQIQTQIQTISVPTLRRWNKQLQDKGPEGLVGRALKKHRATKIEQQQSLQDFLVAIITQKPHFAKKPNRLHELIVESANNYPEWHLPSPSSISRWLTRWLKQNGAAFTYLTNPDDYTSKHRPLYGHMYPWVQQPNDCWELDSTPTDVQLQVDGKLKRYSIVAAIDVHTRRVKLILAPTSNSEAICLLLRKCIQEWGVPNKEGIVRTDNGSDYVSERVTAIFEMLDIGTQRANAFSGWEKPYIERFFRTLSEGLLELLPGYIGHNVSERQAIEAAKSFAERIGKGKKKLQQEAINLACTPEELETLINDWLEYKYLHNPHAGKDMKGKTPFEKYTESHYQPRMVSDPRSLDYLLNYVGTATVVRGKISKDSIAYTAPELMNLEWDRRTVRVFIDPTDIGRCILYRDDNWNMHTEAFNVALVGQEIDPEKLRSARKAQQKELTQFRKSAKRLQQDFGIDTLAAEHLAAHKARNNVEHLGLTTKVTDNKALNALNNATAKTDNSPIYSPEQLEQLAQAKAVIEQQQENINQRKGLLIRDEHEKAYHLANESLTRILSEKEEEFLEDYKHRNPFGRRRVEEIMTRRVEG
ncbi:DNA-binding protein [Thaumasiovibrio subtropicus]|uniref:DNA-binding protein n=1 Tax=Thaumasiovibrio subtropicus TaxID=1891207 RepID=UPI000B35E793|nr:DNA-binding protein [Thaumasiovibrio subtropicus]